jgi:hypothetical protein
VTDKVKVVQLCKHGCCPVVKEDDEGRIYVEDEHKGVRVEFTRAQWNTLKYLIRQDKVF